MSQRNKNIFFAISVFLSIWLIAGCNQDQQQKRLKGPALQHYLVGKLTDAIIYDIYSPPVASRLYAYTNLAYYEATRPAYSSASIINQLNGFEQLKEVPEPKGFHPELAGIIAFTAVAKKLIFSKDSISSVEKDLLEDYENIDKTIAENSINWGNKVASVILDRAAKDNYKITRGLPRYSVFEKDGKWQQTPPDYSDATEPHWRKIIPLLMDSAAQFKPTPPPPYNLTKGSQYYNELMELYETSKKLTPAQDTIAKYWDDNPFVTQHQGHLTFANKKTTPVGHWMGIIEILCNSANKDAIMTAKSYAIASAAIFDGFISCWDEKFRSITARPVTVIRKNIESEWSPLLQTPPFPEYTSGHSVISGAASTVLIHQFGTGFAFHDTTELKYLGMERSFPSIEAATDEIGISRFYGGIHYMSAIRNGKEQGVKIGALYNQLKF
ncbi:MAG: phosphatase PAP2 family protein, partial [Chitinophagia bacterium]|nr:phosphatase PAP2 family protein [Chitinophagia bacterium]